MISVINYTLDRIYCNGELSKEPKKGIDEGLIKFETILTDPEYDIFTDIDNDGNNVLHLIAMEGLYEFYDRMKKHKDFDKMKNKTNYYNMTPFDIATSRIYEVKKAIAHKYKNPFKLIPFLVTQNYYCESVPKLLNMMRNDNLVLSRDESENAKIYFKHACEGNSTAYDIILEIIDEPSYRKYLMYCEALLYICCAFIIGKYLYGIMNQLSNNTEI